jgi:hypothetical protein
VTGVVRLPQAINQPSMQVVKYYLADHVDNVDYDAASDHSVRRES